MSYVKKTWAAGQKVKSADLNNMEGGIDAAANPFVVTLTPTAQDFSGTMDKTIAEITEAYQANKRIFFRVMYSASTYEDVACNGIAATDGYYPSFRGYIITSNMLILAYTPAGLTDGTINDYATIIYPLTPMS